MPPRKKNKTQKPTTGKPGRKPKEDVAQLPQTFTFRISEAVRKQLQERAATEHSSESAVCNRLLEFGLKQDLHTRLDEMEARLEQLEFEPRQVAFVPGTKNDVLAMFTSQRSKPARRSKAVLEEVEDTAPAEEEPEADGDAADEGDSDEGIVDDVMEVEDAA